ncbi:MAG: hypothetical protein VKQ33_04755 [Candidatus Sericytochromatia bacterium]|nr:hypothetical protein [Candidatus Sericytochromatia bacterium]
MHPLHQLYVALHAASLRQLDALQRQDQAAFEAATDERDGLFAAVQRREPELAGLDGQTREGLRATIVAVLASDEALQGLLAEASERTLSELQAVSTGLAALQTYGATEAPPAYYIDRSQ